MIAQEQVVLDEADGRQFEAYLARLDHGTGPGLLILSEMFGLNGPMREVAQAYAARGYCVLVPNVFWRCEPDKALAYEGPERATAWARLHTFDFDRASADLKIATDWLRRSPHGNGKVGALGFCMGGRLAFLAATRAKVDAAISLYGLGLTSHLDEIGEATGRVQLHYGMEDLHISAAEIETVRAALEHHPRVRVYLYPGAGHSFFNPVRPTYDAEAAALAARRIEDALSDLA
ncbi:MAG TPA: dienelactone hydrolase family protein [Stellaceae bacterium]|jgi:carboxymethylenebutenolidase|nr:dienelactone hydrolase family protein [Stellaceae bacterium]